MVHCFVRHVSKNLHYILFNLVFSILAICWVFIFWVAQAGFICFSCLFIHFLLCLSFLFHVFPILKFVVFGPVCLFLFHFLLFKLRLLLSFFIHFVPFRDFGALCLFFLSLYRFLLLVPFFIYVGLFLVSDRLLFSASSLPFYLLTFFILYLLR